MLKRFLKGLVLTYKPSRNALTAFGLGGLSVAAFEPFGFGPIMLVALMGLFWIWMQTDSHFEGFQTGFWFGLGQFGVGVSWLISSIYLFSGVNLALSVIAVFIFVSFLAFFMGVAGYLARYFYHHSRPALVLIVLFPAIWVLVEWLRSTLFGGFPFLLTGNSHLHTWLDGFAPLLGVLGVSWAVALSAALLLWIVLQRTWLIASFALLLLWTGAAGLQTIEWVKPVGAPIKVALLQGNISQDQKWQQEAFMPTMKTYVSQTKSAIGTADLIVWPETAIPAYFDMVEKGALRTFIKDAQLLETDVLLGVITRDQENNKYYNALVNARNPEQEYRKSHLVPFSEYFPFPKVFNALSLLFDIPFSSFSHGDTPKTMKLAGMDVGLSICYEMAFGEELAESLPDAKFLVTVSNDAWFAHTLEPAQQLQDAQMRALELGREVARATNTGYSVVIDTKGNIKAELEPYTEGVLIADVQPYEGLTFYAQWKQLPVLFFLSLIFGFIFAKRFIFTGRFVKR